MLDYYEILINMIWSIVDIVQWDDGACNKRKRGPLTKEKKERKKVLVIS